MNRDWFAQSQPETRGKLRIALDWYPQVVVDLHEMGGESTYYFAPPADPINPFITKAQAGWLESFGRANAAAFDSRGFPYFTREVYDSFYPGYGESWPIFQGAVGMTYEQASARGLVYRREDGSLLTYRMGVVQHFTAAITTVATAAANREKLLRDFLEYRRSAVADGERVAPREYVLVPGVDPSKAERLAANLASQGIEVRVTGDAMPVGSRTVPAGAFVVSAAQPSGRLVRNLLEAHVPQPAGFVKEQDRRRRKRLGDQILRRHRLEPAAAVRRGDGHASIGRSRSARRRLRRGRAPAWRAAKVAYLVPWGFDTAALVSKALREGVKIRQADEPFTAGGRRYDAGTAVVRVAENDAPAVERLAALAAAAPTVEVVPLDSAWVDEGVSLGSSEVVALKAPRVLLAWDAPTSSLSAGWTRYVLERRFHLQTTAVRVSSLGRLDLGRFDVLVLPAGSYSPAIDDTTLGRLKEWVRAGGTLVTLGEASRWAAREKLGLLDTRTELRDGRPEVEVSDADKDKARKDGEPKPFDLEKAVAPERERPENTPGAVLRVELDPEHWLSSGHDGEIQAIVEGQRVFTPIRLDKGRNVGLYAAEGSARGRRPRVGRGPRPAGPEGVSHRAAGRPRPHRRVRRGSELPGLHRGDGTALRQRRAARTSALKKRGRRNAEFGTEDGTRNAECGSSRLARYWNCARVRNVSPEPRSARIPFRITSALRTSAFRPNSELRVPPSAFPAGVAPPPLRPGASRGARCRSRILITSPSE